MKKVIYLVAAIAILVGLSFGIDCYRMQNNKPPVFSTWGYDYAPPEIRCPADEQKSFLATVLDETTTYMIVEPCDGEEERRIADRIKIEYDTDHVDYLYGVGRRVVIYYSGPILLTDPAIIHSDDISTEGFRDFELIIMPSEKKEKVLAISKDIFRAETRTLTDINSIDYNVYLYGIKTFDIRVDGETLPASEAFFEGKVSIDAIIAKAHSDASSGVIEVKECNDGGSVVFKYPRYTIIKYHTLDGNRDVYIGCTDMDIDIENK